MQVFFIVLLKGPAAGYQCTKFGAWSALSVMIKTITDQNNNGLDVISKQPSTADRTRLIPII